MENILTAHRRPQANAEPLGSLQLLVHLEQSGFAGAPQFLGTEPDGLIVLNRLSGRTGDGIHRLGREGILETLDSQRQAAEQLCTLIAQSATAASAEAQFRPSR
ncbi:hypothetical protein [Candidatus Poriferisodalis sp.]|uniref:hypothetical protein n=1 Tax=Candidatus Poriferisodalis sp. TaxID=3101277 RepID=UPI003B599A6F